MTFTDATPVIDHVVQSSLCVVAAWLLTLVLRRNRAAIRYSIWMAASAKFLVPFSLLVAGGRQIGWLLPATSEPLAVAAGQLSFLAPFDAFIPATQVSTVTAEESLSLLLPGGLWSLGFAVVMALWFRDWRRTNTLKRHAANLNLPLAIPAMACRGRMVPGIFGIRHPVLLLPEGIVDWLPPAQLEAVIAHEFCHVRRRDNLTAAIHMTTEAIFWFCPVVWWIGSRLAMEREQACDEEVLRTGSDAHLYAEGIVNVCQYYLEAPAYVSAMAGSNLKRRLEAIVANQPARALGLGRKVLLAAASTGAIAIPLAIGIVNAPRSEAQVPATSSLPAFEVASIRVSQVWKAGGEGRFRSRIRFTGNSLTMGNVDLLECVQWAYGVQPHQVSAKGLTDNRYEIFAKASEPVSAAQLRRMLQSLLFSRFSLTLHREKKSLPIYELSVAKGGARLPTRNEADPAQTKTSMPVVRNGGFVFANVSMEDFAEGLSDLRGIDRPVVDRTGIEGRFDITLRSAADAMLREDGPSLFTLIQEQLGLKLVPARGPVEVLVIDHAAEPTEN